MRARLASRIGVSPVGSRFGRCRGGAKHPRIDAERQVHRLHGVRRSHLLEQLARAGRDGARQTQAGSDLEPFDRHQLVAVADVAQADQLTAGHADQRRNAQEPPGDGAQKAAFGGPEGVQHVEGLAAMLDAQHRQRLTPQVERGRAAPLPRAQGDDVGAVDLVAPGGIRIAQGQDAHVVGRGQLAHQVAQRGDAPVGRLGAEAGHDQADLHTESTENDGCPSGPRSQRAARPRARADLALTVGRDAEQRVGAEVGDRRETGTIDELAEDDVGRQVAPLGLDVRLIEQHKRWHVAGEQGVEARGRAAGTARSSAGGCSAGR